MASAPPLPPGFELETAPPAARPQPIIPRTPPPQTAPQRRIDEGRAAGAGFEGPTAQAGLEKTRLETEALRQTQARHGLTAEQYNSLRSQYQSLGLLESGINEVEGLYQQNYRGRRTTIGGYLPNIVNPTARNFEAASDRLMSAIAQAQGLTAQQQNTPAELRIRFGPMIPTATDDDTTIEGKIRALRALLQNQRQTLSQQLGIDDDAVQAVVHGALDTAQHPAHLPDISPSDPNRPQPGDRITSLNVDPGYDPNAPIALDPGQTALGGAQEAVVDEARRSAAQRVLGLMLAGASDADVLNEAQSSLGNLGNIPALLEERRRRGLAAFRRTPPAVDPSTYTTNRERGAREQISDVISGAGNDASGAAVINALDSASYSLPSLFSEGYRRRLSDVRTAHPVASTVGAIAGGLFAPGGIRPGMQLGEQMLRGAGQGAVYGFNSSGGDPGSAITGAGVGGLAPPTFRLAGAGARGAYRAVAGRGATGAFDGATAARELDIPLMPGDVGGPFTRRATSFLAQLPFSTSRITNAYEATVNAARGVRDRVAQTVAGTGRAVPETTEAAGEIARQGALAYRTSSRDAVGRAYDRAAELAGDTRITPTNALEALDRNIAELGEVPGGAPSVLTALRQQLDGDFTVSGLRNLRTRLRDDFASQGLRGSDIERRAMQVVDALSDDINTGLTRAGRSDAAAAYRAADQLHRQRVETIDSVLMPIIGRNGEKSGEEIIQALQRASHGNSQRLERFINTLPADEARDVRASLIGQLGRATNSQQNAAGDAFSLETFLTHYNAMQPSARRTVFGREGMRALDQLAQVADLRRQAGRFANRSQTGTIIGGVATGGSAAGGLPAFVTAALAQYGGARLLTSPKLVRFLARMPREPGRLRSYIGRLDIMARAETNPALAQQFRGFADALQRAANDNVPLSAAATPSDGERQDDR